VYKANAAIATPTNPKVGESQLSMSAAALYLIPIIVTIASAWCQNERVLPPTRTPHFLSYRSQRQVP
jgi:hypothetical protein